MTQVLRPAELLSDLQEVMLLKDPGLLRDILERISVTADGLERGIKAEVGAREEAIACAAEQHEAISKTVKLWDGRMQATETRLDAMHQQLTGLQLCSASVSEAGASVEHVLQQMQQDIQKLRLDFINTSGPSQSAMSKAVARVDKLEKQVKVHKEESWSRFANVERQCETQEQTLHAEIVKRVGRRELEKSMDELRQELFKVRGDLCREAADMEQSLQIRIQTLKSDTSQLRSQLSTLSIEAKECVSKPPEVSMAVTEVQSATHGTQGDMTESLHGRHNGFAESKGIPLLQPQHSESLPCPLRPPVTSRPVGRRPFSAEPQLGARHAVAQSGSSVPDSRGLSRGVPPLLHSTHDEHMSEGLSTQQTAQPLRCRSTRRPTMPGRLKLASARTHQNDVRSLVVEACRVQSSRSIVM